jgi:hypothetical protein
MIRVTMFNPEFEKPKVLTFPDSYITKVLQSGALRISMALEADVPEMGDDDDKEMAVRHELTMAVVFGRYIMERVDD